MGTFRWARLAPLALSTVFWAATIYLVSQVLKRAA
jgi:hypothetical protein